MREAMSIKQSIVRYVSLWRFFALLFSVALGLLMLGCGGGTGTGGQDSAEQAEAECNNYPTEDIRFVVPFTAGGTYDALARLFAPFIADNLPNDANVIVENRTGAGGLSAANQLHNAAPDGSEIQIMNLAGLAAAQVMGEVDYEITDFVYLGQLNSEPQILYVGADSDINNVEDLQQSAPITQAMVSFTSSEGVATVVLYDALGIEYEPVLHEGGSERDLSVIRGDSDAGISSLVASLENVQAGELKPILVLSDEKPAEGEIGYEEVRDVETVVEAGYPEIVPAFQAPRVVSTAPNTPDCIQETLAQALQDAAQDAKLQEQAEESGLLLAPLDDEETNNLVNELIEIYSQYSDALIEAAQEG